MLSMFAKLIPGSLPVWICSFLAGALAASILVGYLVHENAELRLQREIKQARDEGQAEADRIAEMFASELVARQLAERRVFNLDRDSRRRLNEEISKNSMLADRLRAGGSMYVRGITSGASIGGSCKESTTTPTGLDHGAGIRLPTDSGRNVLRIRKGILSDREKIDALQRYIIAECTGEASTL